jgi:hypothetical protein
VVNNKIIESISIFNYSGQRISYCQNRGTNSHCINFREYVKRWQEPSDFINDRIKMLCSGGNVGVQLQARKWYNESVRMKKDQIC